MSNVTFKEFKIAVQAQIEMMGEEATLFQTTTNSDQLWDLYLDSFPEGTNKVFRERREYDCQCCRAFIRKIGGVVAFVGGKKVSVWDIEVGGYYQPVIDALREFVMSHEIDAPFFHDGDYVGTDHNIELLAGGDTRQWEHFYCVLNGKHVMEEAAIASHLSLLRGNHQVLQRSLEELTLSSGEIVLDLIENGSLYRGDEMKARVDSFIALKTQFDAIEDEDEKAFFIWNKSLALGAASRIRNSAIGSLLVDISEGVDLEDAVAKFEDKVSEGKYKRTSAVVTQGMISKAKDTIVTLGLEDALYRRYARLDDLTINNVLFANRDARKAMNPFDMLAAKAPAKVGRALQDGQQIHIEEFMETVVPHATNIEVLFENKHMNNLVSLIAPEDLSAGNMLKWDNNFSWSYRGEVTDSIRERVKKAGGNVEGKLRCSLSWSNKDDLDIHVTEPSGFVINFSKPSSGFSDGQLDVDMNAYGRLSEEAVENIFWKKNPQEGRYKVRVHNYTKRCTDASKDGFEIEVDNDGDSTIFGSNNNPRGGEYVTVVEFNYSKENGVEFVKGSNGKNSTKSETVWGIPTNTFQKVNMIMNSPNHWDNNCTGNKHLFFSLVDCRNEEETRGFYNEYLRDELYEHRKTFEVLGSQLKAPKSDDQVSGLGFSSTKRADAIFKVDGRQFRVLF